VSEVVFWLEGEVSRGPVKCGGCCCLEKKTYKTESKFKDKYVLNVNTSCLEEWKKRVCMMQSWLCNS